MTEIPTYPAPKIDPVKRSLERPDACAKPCTIGNTKVRIRVSQGDKSLKRKKRKRPNDKRDVHFF